MFLVEWLITAGVGTGAALVGIYMLYIGFTGSHEDLETLFPEFRGLFGEGFMWPDSTSIRRVIYIAGGVVSLLTSLGYFFVLLYAF